MPTADVNGQTLYYEIHGEGEPLVIVMGLSADILAWALQIPEWSKQYKVIAIENRDVGRSSYATEQYDIVDMADDVLALADELGIDEFHLAGLSMGGAISQELALKAPERVKTLTLVVTWGGSGFVGRERTRLWTKRLEHETHEDHIDDLMLSTFSERFMDNDQMRNWLRDAMLANPNPQKPEGFARQLDACGRHETRDRLGQIDIPTHVIGGEYDALLPIWKSKELADGIPGAKYTVVARAPHGINVEHATEFNALVLDFLNEHAKTPA
jgi:pimeloyl-ACP methyl ester carboxylesterase